MDVGGQRHALATLPPGMTRYPLYGRLGGPRAGLAPHWDSITGPFSPLRVAIQTTLSRPTEITYSSEIQISTSKTERRYSQDNHIISIMVIKRTEILDYVCLILARQPQWVRVSSFTRFLYCTQWRTTVGRTPLEEWSARRRDLYLTSHNTHNRQTSMVPVRFEPTIPAGKRPQTYGLDCAATGSGLLIMLCTHKSTEDRCLWHKMLCPWAKVTDVWQDRSSSILWLKTE